MKYKYLLIISLLLFIIFTNVKPVSAEDTYTVVQTSSGDKLSFTTNNGDNVSFEKKTGSYEYRVSLNNEKALNLSLKDRFSFVRFIETTSYYFFYGSMYKNYESDSKTTIPYIVRIEKNLSNAKYYFDESENVSGMAHMVSILEFGADNLIVLECTDGNYANFGYTGLYELKSFSNDLVITSALNLGEKEIYPYIAYDRLDMQVSDGTHMYFDKDFNMIGKYGDITVNTGYYELMESCYVNGEYYRVGSVFNEPGIYTLDDGYHAKINVTIEASVSFTGEENNGIYKDYLEYKATGGNITINGEPVYMNGILSKPGKYSMLIYGINGYTKEYDFIISPELYTEIEDGGTLDIGDTLQFTGEAKLNGTLVSTGYVLKEPGTYVLDLCAGDTVVDEIRFTVPDVIVTGSSKTVIYIVMGSAIIILLSGLVLFLTLRKKHRKGI